MASVQPPSAHKQAYSLKHVEYLRRLVDNTAASYGKTVELERTFLDRVGLHVDEAKNKADYFAKEAEDYIKSGAQRPTGLRRLFFKDPEKQLENLATKIESLQKQGLRNTSKRKTTLTEITGHSIMFGLMLFSIVLMLSKPQLTGLTILSLPVMFNWPFVLGAIIFVLDILAIEQWYSSSARTSKRKR